MRPKMVTNPKPYFNPWEFYGYALRAYARGLDYYRSNDLARGA
jgi:hypothetical protein